ncbi:MAG TPA: tetratricopeptide repeat protein [Opitutales bacterium]|nr:tetratricopeptide repeat protein [Opitutales bacterium]
MFSDSKSIVFICLAALLLAACSNKTQEAADHAKSGMDKYDKGDLSGALAELDQAIAAAPTPQAEYLNDRALVQLARNDFATSIADATKAIAINPKLGAAFGNRALAEQDNGNFTAAIADFTQGIALQPAFAPYYGYRGELLQNQNDFAGAVADYDKFISLQSSAGPAVRLYRYVLLRRLGRDSGDFASTVASWSDSWTKNIGLFLLGKMSEADLLTAAESGPPESGNDRQCQANYYIGEMHLINKDPAGARPFIALASALEGTNCDEYGFARTELAHLPKP